MITLAVDAATSIATVAVFRDESLVVERAAAMRGTDRESLLPTVHDTLGEAALPLQSVDRIVCGNGPGSFTSLRIAASTVKGLAFGLGAPVDVVSSLALVVASAPRRAGRYLACLDALRGQTYAAGYVLDANGISEMLPPHLARNEDVASLAESIGAAVIGPGQAIDSSPHARGALTAAPLTVRDIDLARWEPTYGRKAEAQARWEAAHGRPLPRG